MNENAIHIGHSTGRVKSCPEILVLQADRRQDKDVTNSNQEVMLIRDANS